MFKLDVKLWNKEEGNIFENPELIDPVLIESYEALQEPSGLKTGV